MIRGKCEKAESLALVAVLVLAQVVYMGGATHFVGSVEAAVSDDVNILPVVEIVPDVSSGKAPLEVKFDGDAWDEDGLILSVEWDFEGDGVFEDAKSLVGIERPLLKDAVDQELQKQFVYTKPGIYHALVRATDDKGESAVSSVTIQVYSDMPWLDVVASNKNDYPYMARAGYEAFFKDGISEDESVKFQIRDAWISYKLRNQTFGDVNKTKGIPSGNQIMYQNVFPDIDVRYTVYDDLLLEEFIVYEKMPLNSIDQEFSVHGVEYVMNEDGSIGFYNGETLVFSIPKPVMYELNNLQQKSYGLHYEIIEKDNTYILRKIIEDQEWLKKAKYPVVIDGTTSSEIADPWEQQGLTPYGQYFENLNEYVDPMTGHLTIRQTDYFLSGRGLDLLVTRVYSTVVAYKEEENEPGEYIPVATYMEAPTDLGCGWSLDFPWLELQDGQPGKYLHLPRGVQVKTNFQSGVWVNETYGFTMYQLADQTYVRYRNDGIQEEFDTEGRIVSITDLNGNVLTFTYANDLLHSITDTVGRVLSLTYAYDKLVSISDGVKTTIYSYSGDKLVAVTDPLGRVTTYSYLAENSFLITGVHYPTGGFSSYEYSVILPDNGKLAPYKSADNTEGELVYYMAKVDSADTVTWSSPQDMSEVTISAGRPCAVQRDDGTFVMYYKDKYVWTETVWKCQGGDCWEEIITHTEYWIKRSVSADQHHWSTPQNVVQVKSTTGNPVIIEKQNGSYIMYYKDKYVWTEENCYWDRLRKEWVCETITHTEYWIYRRTSTDGVIWGGSVKFQQTVLSVSDVSAIQKQDSTFLMCYTDKVGSSYYIRQKTSTDGVTWSSPSNVILVDSQTGDPALLQRDSGTVYLAYRKGSNIYAISNSGSGWSSPVQTPAVAQGNPALLDLITDIVLIYKGTDGYYYRISSPDGSNWSSPSLIAPNKPITSPSTMIRKDRMYRVTAQYISSSATDLVRVTEFSYEGDSKIPWSSNVLIRDAQTLQSSMHFEYDSKGRPVVTISKDAQGVQTQKVVWAYNGKDKVIRQDVYAGNSTEISFSTIAGYDDHGNTVYTRGPEGAENFYSYANTNSQNQFVDSKGVPVTLFSDQFYTNSVPSDCYTLLVGQAFINNGKVQEVYHKYDSNGNLMETKTLFPTRNYAVFSGTFDEPGQTSFTFDLTGLTITDGILVISSIAVPTPETLYETESEPGKGWQNTGTWEGKYFKADYIRCVSIPEPDCYDGQTKIGPFEHYPGSPNYTGYTTWIEDNLQYVKTSYSAVVNEYPAQVDYKLNTSSWSVITQNLGSGTTSIVISASNFVQGLNTLQFQESNTYSTKFEWTLYIDQGAAPDQYTTSFAHDTYGNITSITDALGSTTCYQYDSNHLYLTSITNALNHTISATHNFATGLLTSITDANGNTSSFEYDILGRITKKINPDLTELEAVYDDQNNKTTIYDELDHYMIQYYDGLNRLTRTDVYLTPTTYLTETFTRNYQDKVVTKTDPGGHTYVYEYDSQGRATRTTNPDSTFRQIHYNDATNTVSLFDENQHKKEYHCDWTGNLLWVKEYTDAVNYYLTEYTYDTMGNLTSLTDANGNTTLYEYDSIFGVTQVTYPDLTAEILSYDAVGNILLRTDGNGATQFMYNGQHQLVEVVTPDQSSITFEYDANGNLVVITDFAGSTSYTYDNRNRSLSETRTIAGTPYTVSNTYDAASRLASITYPDQSVITYEYDSLNRLTNIPGYAEITYNADSLMASMTYSNQTVTSFQYDNCHLPVTIHVEKNDPLLTMNYQYDLVGNIMQLDYNRKQGQEWVQSTEVYTYDWLDRLVSAQGDYGSQTYSYDPVGNRLSLNDVTYTYNTMNELLSISDGSTFTYDEMGNTLSKAKSTDTWAYTYNKQNRLTQVEKNSQLIAQYVYDGNGKRTQKTEWVEDLQNYQTKIYVYSGQHIIYEKNTTTNQEATYVYGPMGKIAKNTSGLTDYYHNDHLGSVRLKTDESGNVITTVTYTPFGEDTVTGNEPYTYNGKEKDLTQLHYFGARYYDPETGRFLSRDLVSGQFFNPQTLNKYTYVLNNPLRYRDPDGREQAGALINGGSSGYPSLDNLGGPMSWSWAPQNIGKVSPGNPACVVAMFILMFGIFGLEIAAASGADLSVISEGISSFGKEAVSLACEVGKAVFGMLKSLYGIREIRWLFQAVAGGYLYSVLKSIYKIEIQTLKNILSLLEHLPGFWKQVRGFVVDIIILSDFSFAVMVTFLNGKGEPICGSVTFSSGDNYVWKLVDSVYYVLINDEWVSITDPEWRPGKPLPPGM